MTDESKPNDKKETAQETLERELERELQRELERVAGIERMLQENIWNVTELSFKILESDAKRVVKGILVYTGDIPNILEGLNYAVVYSFHDKHCNPSSGLKFNTIFPKQVTEYESDGYFLKLKVEARGIGGGLCKDYFPDLIPEINEKMTEYNLK